MVWILQTHMSIVLSPSLFDPPPPSSLSGNLFMELLQIANLFPWGLLSFRLARRVCVRQLRQLKKKSFYFDILSH